jgi:hypothetical protein
MWYEFISVDMNANMKTTIFHISGKKDDDDTIKNLFTSYMLKKGITNIRLSYLKIIYRKTYKCPDCNKIKIDDFKDFYPTCYPILMSFEQNMINRPTPKTPGFGTKTIKEYNEECKHQSIKIKTLKDYFHIDEFINRKFKGIKEKDCGFKNFF